jgi:hypothetical protein
MPLAALHAVSILVGQSQIVAPGREFEIEFRFLALDLTLAMEGVPEWTS